MLIESLDMIELNVFSYEIRHNKLRIRLISDARRRNYREVRLVVKNKPSVKKILRNLTVEIRLREAFVFKNIVDHFYKIRRFEHS